MILQVFSDVTDSYTLYEFLLHKFLIFYKDPIILICFN